MDESVSAAMDSYAMKGWTLLNDGCPDCNTPLMRNQEATSQVCVNCEINPPVDSDDEEGQKPAVQSQQTLDEPPTIAPQQQDTTAKEDTPTNDLPSFIANMTLPPHLTSLPSLPAPGPIRPQPHIAQRASVLDPMDPSRKIYRWPSGRIIGTTGLGPMSPTGPLPSSTEPRSPTSRSSTPLPNPPKTPTPRPPHGFAPPPTTTPLSPPPSTPPARTPRDKRSPQNSVVPGSILPPASPLPRKLAMSTSTSPAPIRTSLPTPPTSSTLPSAEYLSYQTAQNFVNGEATTEESHTIEGTQIREDGTKERALKPSPSELERDSTTSVHGGDPDNNEEDEEEDHEESHDEFLDAEEFQRPMSMVSARSTFSVNSNKLNSKMSAESLRVQLSSTKGEGGEQNERATRLIGQKMLEGWAMLQDPCPNPGCNEITLIQSPDNRVNCVVCEQFFDDDLPSSSTSSNNTMATKSKRNSPSFALSSSFTSNHTLINSSTFSFPSPPSTLPSTPIPSSNHSSNSRSTSSPATMSPPLSSQYRVTSPISSPSQGRATREAYGRISNSIILPPQVAPMSPSFGMTSQQILNRHLSDDIDKLASEDEETRRHLQLIGKVNEFASRSLPPVPPVPTHSTTSSRPASTYSNNSSDGNTGTKDHPHRSHSRRHHQHTHSNATSVSGSFPSPSPAWPSPAPVSPEVQAIVTATHKTIATLVVKLETYRQALEVTENLKECQALTAQIKGMMECLKACRDTLDASSIGQSQHQQPPPPPPQQSHHHLHNQFPSPPMSPPYPPSQPLHHKEGPRAIKSQTIHLPSPPPLPLPQAPSS
ncbi:hypothetical protein BGZ81_007788 [Podila clonocystis]|nr:hypothetical protein BGZ81_007788 [Podila clonocystis]